MDNKKCTNCGLVSYGTATACGRCGQAFSASPYVDAVFADPNQWAGGGQYQQGPYPPAPPYGQQVAGGTFVDRDAEHLRLLSIFHYVVGAILGLMACIPIIHLLAGIGLLFVGAASQDESGAPPAALGLFFIVIAATIILTGWTVAGCTLAAGRFLAQRRRHTFCLIVACVLCLFMPLGAILGVFSIIVLNRTSVKAMFR
jgi:hypothetical protein